MAMKIRQGDVILFRSAGTIIDKIISIVSPRYTHVGIALDNHRYLDARMWRVSIRVLNDEDVAIFRPRANQHQIKAGLIWGLSHNQEKYSILSAIVAGVLRLAGLNRLAYSVDNRWICSEYVGGCLKAMGIFDTVGEASLGDILPDDIAALGCLTAV